MLSINSAGFKTGRYVIVTDEVTLDDGRKYVCTANNQLWALMDVVSHPYYTELKKTASYKIVNGPDSGQTITPDPPVEDGQILNMRGFGNICSISCYAPIRYAQPMFKRRYHILGDCAYYLGEEIIISLIVEEAERVLGPIATKLNAESEGGQ